VNYRKPLLSPFEVFNSMEEYKMDYYSKEGSAPWKNYNNENLM
jgi:2-(3-amino-3-carboxypropyl)histidine synthase